MYERWDAFAPEDGVSTITTSPSLHNNPGATERGSCRCDFSALLCRFLAHLLSDLALDSPLLAFPEVKTPPQTTKPRLCGFSIIQSHYLAFFPLYISLSLLIIFFRGSFCPSLDLKLFTLRSFLVEGWITNMLLFYCMNRISTTAASSLACLDVRTDCRSAHGVRTQKTGAAQGRSRLAWSRLAASHSFPRKRQWRWSWEGAKLSKLQSLFCSFSLHICTNL